MYTYRTAYSAGVHVSRRQVCCRRAQGIGAVHRDSAIGAYAGELSFTTLPNQYWRQESRKACATSMPPAPNGCSETLTRPRLNVVAECSSTAIGVPPGNHNAACLPVVFYLSSRRCRGALSGHHSHASLAHASTLHLRHCLSKPLASSTPSSPTRHPPVRHSLHQIQLDLASQRAPR